MQKVLLILCLAIPTLCTAQGHTIDFGLSTPLFFRPSLQHEITEGHLHLFGVMGIDGVLRVKGTEENDMSFVMNVGISDDMRKYNAGYSMRVSNNLYFVNINPSVMVPSKWPNIQFCMGIGTLVRLGQGVVYSWSATSMAGGTSLDSMDNLLTDNARNIIPYISLGLSDHISKHFRLELTIQPTLLNFYEPGTSIDFTYTTGNSSGSTLFDLNYQPVYVGVRLFYFFKG